MGLGILAAIPLSPIPACAAANAPGKVWANRVKAMVIPRENRPLSVTVNTKRTCCVFGVGGARRHLVEKLAANADCAALPLTAVYFGPVEMRNWLVPGQEQVLTYPHPAVKFTNGVPSFLHRDHPKACQAKVGTGFAARQAITQGLRPRHHRCGGGKGGILRPQILR